MWSGDATQSVARLGTAKGGFLRRRSCQRCGTRVHKGEMLVLVMTKAGERLLCFKCRQEGLEFTIRVSKQGGKGRGGSLG